MADFTTRGQQLALDQLQDIAAASDDTIDIVDVKPPAEWKQKVKRVEGQE